LNRQGAKVAKKVMIVLLKQSSLFVIFRVPCGFALIFLPEN